MRLLNIREDAVCEGKAVASVMEEDGFRRLLGGRQQFSDTIRLPEKNIWLERFFCCDRDKTVLLCVLRDVTGQRLREEDPGSVISVLLAQQEQLLQEEIGERREKLDRLTELKKA
jgi:hypothetical protein